MDASQVLFASVSSLTGGLITDLQTAMIALLSISFICMAVNLLRSKVFFPSRDESASEDDEKEERGA